MRREWRKLMINRLACNCTRWHRGVAVECRTCDQEVAGSSLGRALRRKNSGQVSHTYVPLSPSSITWYRSKGSCLAPGEYRQSMVCVWVAVKTVWSPCYIRAVSDFSLLSCARWVQGLSSSFQGPPWHGSELSEWALPTKRRRHCSFSTSLCSTRWSPSSTQQDKLWKPCICCRRADVLEQT